MEKIRQWGVRAVETDPMTVRRGYDGPSSGYRSVTQYRTGDAPFIPYDPIRIVSVLIYICLTQIPSKLAML